MLTAEQIDYYKNKYNSGSGQATSGSGTLSDFINKRKGTNISQTSQTTQQETGKTGVSGLALGAGKGIWNTIAGVAELGKNVLNAPLKAVGINTPSMNLGGKNAIPEELRTAKGKTEKIGFGAEQIAEYLVPGSASLKAGKVAQTAVGAGKLGTLARLGTTALTEGVLGTGQSALQSGELGKKELGVGAISTLVPPVMEGTGKVLSKLIPLSVKNKISTAIVKAIKPSTKSVKNPNYMDDAVKAFKVLDDNKPNFNGEIRNPRTVAETFDNLKSAKQNIYNQYNDIAKKSGEVGAKFTPQRVMADISNWIKGTGYSSEMKEYAAKRLQQLADLENAPPTLVQDRIRELNSGVSFFTSGSEKLKNQIDASIANRLRKQLDETIFNSTGQPYQAIKNKYAALKTIEDDLARTTANMARRGQKGFFDITDIINGEVITHGILTGNPTTVITGATGNAIKNYIKYLNDPDRYIKEIFKLTKRIPSETPTGVLSQKLLTAGQKGKESINTPINLPTKTASTLEAEQVAKFGKGNYGFSAVKPLVAGGTLAGTGLLSSKLKNKEQPIKVMDVTKLKDKNQEIEDYVKNIKVIIDSNGELKRTGNNLAVKNNNPGNLKYAGQPNAKKDINGFAVFPTPEIGFRALIKDVQAKQKRGLTLERLITQYAPPKENNTKKYIKTVSDWLGVKSDVNSSTIDPIELAKAMARFESQTQISE